MQANERKRFAIFGAWIAAWITLMDANACSPVFYVPHGFYVARGPEVPAATAVIHLPANALGPLYTDARNGVPHRPLARQFRLVDLATGRRLRVRIGDAPGMSEIGGVYRIEPEGGFAAGHAYALSTMGKHESNSPFHPSLRLEIDGPMAWPPTTGAIRIGSKRGTFGETSYDMIGPAFDSSIEPYRDQVTTTLSASPMPSMMEMVPIPCDRWDSLTFRPNASCHTVTANVRFPALSDVVAVVSGPSRPSCPRVGH
ncbi:hypothetical protein [Dyella subtropica]|uniref:hypothetical protein n=1 Tax=Dyella subtropica TaxID=2992127 RepID=UPI0022510E4C|nr:hypothetical protein [Dyella subtropica]